MSLLLWLGLAYAQDPPDATDAGADRPPSASGQTETADTELDALRARVLALEQAALLRDAEDMARAPVGPPPPPPRTRNAFNPAITAFGDLLVSVGADADGLQAGSGPWMRSLELDLRADVDPFAKAVAVIAIEQEPPLALARELAAEPGAEPAAPSFSVAPEELYLDLVRLPVGLSARLGSFRQPFGTTNRAHPHDYPWPDLPGPLAAVLGEEGLTDTGGLLAWRIPNRWGVGFTLEGAALAGSLPDLSAEERVPRWLGRAELFHEVGRLQIGLGASASGWTSLAVGADLMVRYVANSWRSFVVIVEAVGDGSHKGGFASVQVQPSRTFYLGGRADLLDGVVRAGGFVTAYTSEFLRFRAGAMGGGGEVEATAQITFVFGSHPVEPYWVNR